MKKRNMVVAVLAIITMGLAIPLGAQSSNQREATATVFSNDVDNYMNVNKNGDVKFGSGFALLDYTSSLLALGYATRFGDIYLGTYYNGNIFTHGTNETTKLTTTWDTNLQQMLTRVDEKVYTRTSTASNNNIAALIGVAGMGIKVGFYENIMTYNTPYYVTRNGTSTKTTNADGTITYSNNDSLKYYEQTGTMMPSIQWGMKLPIGSYTLLPRVGANYTFYENQLIDKYYTSGRTVYQGDIVGQESVSRRGQSNDYDMLNVTAGVDFNLDSKTGIILDYGYTTRFYNNSYGETGRSGSVKGTVSWAASDNYTTINRYFDRTVKADYVGISVSEESNTSHSITPQFLWRDSAFGENLKFGVRFSAPITIGNTTTSGYSDSWSTRVTTYNDENDSQKNTAVISNSHTAGNKVETSTFTFKPTVGIGASYGLIPNKFTVNAGVMLTLPQYSSTNTVTSINGIGSSYSRTEIGSGSTKYVSSETYSVVNPTPIADTVATVTSWGALSGGVRGGFVFNFNENFMLDMAAGTSNFTYDLTSLTVLFTIKFNEKGDKNENN